MSQPHLLPLGAPTLRIDYASYLSFDAEEVEEIPQVPHWGDDSDNEPQASAGQNQRLAEMLSVSNSAVGGQRRRGKDAKPVDQLDIKTGELLRRYASQTDACTIMKVSQIYISECCRGLRSDCFGFKWRFADDAPIKSTDKWVPIHDLLAIRHSNNNKTNYGVKFLQQPDGTIVDPRKLKRPRAEEDGDAEDGDDAEYAVLRPRRRARPVEQQELETGRVLRRYGSQLEAANKMKVNQIHISQTCRGERKDAYGFRWRALEEDEIDEAEEESEEAKRRREASYTSITELLAMKKRYDQAQSEVALKTVEQLRVDSKTVVRRYASLADVSESLLGVGPRAILRCLHGTHEQAYGFLWRIYDGPDIADCTCCVVLS